MAHIFFERLEKRQSTQSLLPSLSGAIAIYSAPAPGYPGWGNSGYTPSPSVPALLYGINFPGNYSGSFFPWSSPYGMYGTSQYGMFGSSSYGLFGSSLYGGMFGSSLYNPYSQWTNPFNQYSPLSFGGFGNFFSPIGNFFGGLFGGLFGGNPFWQMSPTNPISPDIRLLYGVINPSPPTSVVAYYGISTPYGLF
jgi:hypothetical protein